jgi:hypothetical protein
MQNDDVLVAWWQEILLDSFEELALCHDSDPALLVTKSWSVQWLVSWNILNRIDFGIHIIYQKTLLVMSCLCFRNSECYYYSVAKQFVLASN